jgi:catechol 2,3-dioxygenase-like lactoylglutathione lyase family enzyme
VSVRLNHTIIWCRDKRKSALFFTGVFGLPEAMWSEPFYVVQLSNDVSLDFHEKSGEVSSQHYAFLISESEFDEIFGRIRERAIRHWADPGRQHANEINRNDGGRGVYFEDLDGHLLEIITRPYGSAA